MSGFYQRPRRIMFALEEEDGSALVYEMVAPTVTIECIEFSGYNELPVVEAHFKSALVTVYRRSAPDVFRDVPEIGPITQELTS